MSELKIRPAENVRKEDYEKFEKDLELFLGAFTPQLLAEWMKKNKGNISKKLNGNEAITRNDIRDFYASVSSVINKLREGIHAYQIELEMTEMPVEEAPLHYQKNIWEEIRLIKATLQEHSAAIGELKDAGKGPQNAPNPQNP